MISLAALSLYVLHSGAFAILIDGRRLLPPIFNAMVQERHLEGQERVVAAAWTATVAVLTQAVIAIGIAVNFAAFTLEERTVLVVELVAAAAWTAYLIWLYRQ